MYIKVLGSGAGGGLPQWNCNAINSKDARNGHEHVKPRSQSSIAVSANNKDWLLLNASPDIRQQIFDTKQLHPHADGPLRNSPIQAVILTNGDVDHVTGLLCLREGHYFNLFASNRVLGTINANTIFNVLNEEKVQRIEMALNTPFEVMGPNGSLGLEVTPFDVPGKVALYLEEDKGDGTFGTKEGDTIGLKVKDIATGKSFFYIPGCAMVDAPLRERITDAELIFFDGTLFTNNEMLDQGLLPKTGERMGHMNMSGEDGTLKIFEDMNINRKIYIHINNSNPVLRDNSPERKIVESEGWEVSYDGMEVTL